MILTYPEVIEECGNAYQLNLALKEGRFFKLEEGIYSSTASGSELGVMMKKYPKAVLAGEYAFYYHGLTDVIPEKYDLATPSKAAKIKDQRVHQIYIKEEIFPLGIEERESDGTKIRIYDRERMLLELLRHKNSMPYDLYKEVLLHYREIINGLQIWRIQEYIRMFPKGKMIARLLDEEVM